MAHSILVLSYWSLNDGLTQGAVLPHLSALSETAGVGRLILATLEREHLALNSVQLPKKVNHRPIYLKPYSPKLFNKAVDFVILPAQLKSIAEEENVSGVIAVGTLAGSLAHLISAKSGIPYYVSSFEPHAEYMLESKVWAKYGLKYNFQKRWEQREKKEATGLMPVAEAYKQELLREKVPEAKIKVVPCAVNLQQFTFNEVSRESIREAMDIGASDSVGIYVGKYGSLYYEQEAFNIYKKCFELIPNLRLIILSPQSQGEIVERVRRAELDLEKVFIASVPHHEVPQYLSAADFAFATIKSYPSARYCSPIKIGEYWANGLPVLLTEGVGDDSDIIKKEGGGAVFNLQEQGSLDRALQQIQQILKDPKHRQEIPKLAEKYRNPDRIREAYAYFFGQKQEEES